MSGPTFLYQGRELPLFCHLYNLTYLNERGVEVAVAFDWWKRTCGNGLLFIPDEIGGSLNWRWQGLEASNAPMVVRGPAADRDQIIDREVARQQATGLEVGNVLAHYNFPGKRAIVDQYEHPAFYQDPGAVQNVDLFELTNRHWPWIVSISTIEHVGIDFPNAHSGADALRHLTGLLAPGGRMLVTFPTGVNQTLDALVVAGDTGATRSTVLVHDGPGAWSEGDPGEVVPYGVRDEWAGAVWIGEWE